MCCAMVDAPWWDIHDKRYVDNVRRNYSFE